MEKMIMAGLVLFMALIASVGCAGSEWMNDAPPQEELLHFGGATTDNFMDRYYNSKNPLGGYVMPEIDPATAIVVDGADGDDANPGTLEAPFRTISRGIEELQPGGTLIIREGEYFMSEGVTLTADHSGTPENPTVITGHIGEKVTLTAAEPITGWRPLDGHDDVWFIELAEGEGAADWAMIFVDGEVLPSVSQAEYASTGNRGALNRRNEALEEAPFIPEAGAWGVRDGAVYIRPADGKSPEELDIEAARNGEFTLITLDRSDNIILNRLRMERAHGLIRNNFSNRPVIRHCVLRQSKSALTGSGKDAVEPLYIDYTLMESNGWYRGRNIYNLTPMNIRYCLFRDMPPQGDAITAYTSTPNQFHNVHIENCTFINTGACIYLVSGESSVRNNVAYTSRFVSSSGRGNVIEGNLVVNDPRDADEPDTPRRNIGFRMYADGGVVKENIFIGFDRGMLVRQTSEEDETIFSGNRFYGYTDYGVFLVNKDNLRFVNNLFAPGEEGAPLAADGDENEYDLEAFEALGLGEGNRLIPGAEHPAIPHVIHQAMEK